MLERVLIAGSGGQGIVLISKLLASVAVRSVEHITFFPSYGAEVRGGTSHCQVILSSDEIASPVTDTFDTMILMNQPSLDRFLPEASKDTRIIVNSSLCDVKSSPSVKLVDATRMAIKLGNRRVANFVMLGAYIALTGTVQADNTESAIRLILEGKDPTLIEQNIKAFDEGLNT